MTQLRQIYQKF